MVKGRYDAENRHRIVSCHVFTLFYQRQISQLLTFLWASKVNRDVVIRNKRVMAINIFIVFRPAC
jgi:hypothetical protein